MRSRPRTAAHRSTKSSSSTSAASMRTPAAAIAWELRQRHRWGLIALLATILILGAIKFVAHPQLNDATFPLLLPIPLGATSLYLLAVFTFGISGDLAARESMYPSRM